MKKANNMKIKIYEIYYARFFNKKINFLAGFDNWNMPILYKDDIINLFKNKYIVLQRQFKVEDNEFILYVEQV